MADLRLNILGNDEASVSLDSVQGKVLGLGKALIEFSKSSVKAFEDQAKADRQLAAVAGQATEAFKAQASALQESLGVSDDHVQKLQTMLLRYGEAPAEIDKTVRAILDFSAATGQDAESAISQLTSSVTTGKMAFKDLGLQYDQTGSRGDVLKAATEALAAKFGGAAAADANSLTGSVEKAKQQFGELQETFGQMIADFVVKTDVVSGLTQVFRELNYAMGGGESDLEYSAAQKRIHGIANELQGLRDTFRDLSGQNAPVDVLEKIIDQIADAEKRLKQAKGGGLATTGAANATKAGRAGGSDDSMARFKESLQERISVVTDAAEREAKLWDEHDRAQARVEEEAERDRLNAFKENLDERIDAITDSYVKEAKLWEEHDRAQAYVMRQQEEQFARSGDQIGMAFVNALNGAISEAASGGEADIGETLGDIAAGLLPVLGGIIGTAIGPGGTAIGSAIGGLAGTAVRGLSRKKRHSGGYAGDSMARYHAGTWVGSDEEAAVLQNGERVLSRSEVSAMGGPSGVEGAVRGRSGGSTVNIQTFDAGSFREIFQGRGGRGLLDATRTGVGAPALLFGGR